MIKCINNNDVLIISHIADCDGAGSIILGNKFFDGLVDYVLCEVRDLKELFMDDFSSYKEVFLCDLPLCKKEIDVIDKNESLKSKLKQFDHHEFLEEYRPSYINNVIEIGGVLTSGTDLFYRYLLSRSDKLNNSFYKTLVEAIRAYDNWDFDGDFELGKKLSALFAIYGPELFIKNMLSMDDSGDFVIPSYFEDLLVANDNALNNYCKLMLDRVLITDIDDYKAGVVVAEQFRSSLGHEICKMDSSIDYALIINLERMTCSLRAIKEDMDLSVVARSFTPTGGGHKLASGFSIDDYSIEKVRSLVNLYLSR